MPLRLGQLVYTSFPRVGFRSLASAQVPEEVQQIFVRQVVYQYWNSYDPPGLGYRAAYLHQIEQGETLFGWVYNDGLDDLGRGHVPYFICYYLAEPLHSDQLEEILACLYRGPITLVDRQCLPVTSETIMTSDWRSYPPVRMGVTIPLDVCDRSYSDLKQGKLLDLFIPADEREIATQSNGQAYNQQITSTTTRYLVIEGIKVDAVGLKGAAKGSLNSQDEYQKIVQLYAQALGQPSTRTALDKRKKGLTPFTPSYKSVWLFTGLCLTAVVLTVGMYERRGWQQGRSQLPQVAPQTTHSPVVTRASWQNARAETLSGHRGTVWSVAISPDGQTFASGSSDRTIKVWNLNSGALLRTLEGHTDTVWSVAISPDGQTLVSSSSDRTIKVWNLNSGALLRTLSGHRGTVWSVAISPDGQTLVSGSSDRTIKVWNLGSGALLRTLKGHTDAVRAVTISPSGQTLASGSSDRTIKIWYIGSGELLHTLSGHNDRVISVAISPDRKILASGSVDKTVKIWHLGSRTLLRTLSGHAHWANSVAISPDGQTLAGGIGDMTKMWDLETGELLYTLPKHSDDITSVCFGANGNQFASGSQDQTSNVWLR